jgi:hypothetical protein
VTPTFTIAIGEGTVDISPLTAISGNTGYTVSITYTAGVTAWTDGLLKITLPAGWSPPDANNPYAPGYFSVAVSGGTLIGTGTDGMAMTIEVSGLTALTGKIYITYGDRSFGPGAAAGNPGANTFFTEMDTFGAALAGIQVQPVINVTAPTPTVTPTNTPMIAEGSAVVAPPTIVAGSVSQSIDITYTAGATNWASIGPYYGTLNITIPAGWTPPSTTLANNGYFSVTLSSGSVVGRAVEIDGMTIRIRVRGLLANGTIHVIYGDKTFGGGGVTVQPDAGIAEFIVKADMTNEDGSNTTYPITVQPFITVIAPTPTVTPTYTVTQTVTETVTQTITETHTVSPTFTITETATDSPTPTDTATYTATPTFTVTQTVTGTVTETVTQTVTETVTQTVTETVTQTVTETVTPTVTGTVTQTVTETATPTVTETATQTVTETVTQTITQTVTQTVTPTVTETVTQTVTGTVTPTITQTSTPTFTVTPTNTPIIGEGVVSITPAQAAFGTIGNVLHIVYTAGPTAWTNGKLVFTIPAGWSAPSTNPTDPGYFTVDSAGGSIDGWGINGMDIEILASGLPANSGTITIIYGDKTGGGPGADSQPTIGSGTAVFNVKTDPIGTSVHNILIMPYVTIFAPTQTSTVTPSFTATPTVTASPTMVIGEGLASVSPNVVTENSTGNTLIIQLTVGPTNWAANPDHGTLQVTVPAGWPNPNSVNPLAQGYIKAAASGGVITGLFTAGNVITVQASGVNAGGVITIIYGDKSQGGPGATIPAGTGTVTFAVETAFFGDTTHPILVSPQVTVLAPTPTSTATATETATNTHTVSPTLTVTPTVTETTTNTGTPTATATITYTLTPIFTPAPPSGFYVQQTGTLTQMSWNSNPSIDSYRVYSATGALGKLNTFPTAWNLIATVVPTPAETPSYGYTDATGNTYTFYAVTGVNGAGESRSSSMGSKVIFDFQYVTTRTDVYRLSLPSHVSKYVQASDIVTEIEGSLFTGAKLNQLLLWNSCSQNSIVYMFNTSYNVWTGNNWNVDTNTNSSNALYLNAVSNFSWISAGVDDVTTLVFYYHDFASGLSNINKRSIPYTSVYSKASDIVKDLEGGTGAGSNTKIDKLMVWNPLTQNYKLYMYNYKYNMWLGNDFDIMPGDAVNLYPTSNFTWPVKTAATPVP